MGAWVYYARERARHPDLNELRVPDAFVSDAVACLCRALGLPPVPVKWSRGGGGLYSQDRVLFGAAGALSPRAYVRVAHRPRWLLLAHEVAHYGHDAQMFWTWDATGRKMRRWHRRWHGPEHAALVDRLCAFIREQGLQHCNTRTSGKKR